MYRLHLQYFEIFLKSVKSAHFNELSTIFLRALKIHLFTKIFQNVKIVMLQWNIWQYLTNVSIAMKDWKYFLYVYAIFCAMWVESNHQNFSILNAKSCDLSQNPQK